MSRKPHIFNQHPFEFPSTPEYRAFCYNVVDGDTIDVLIDLGLNQYTYETIRVKDIDTPEIYRPKDDKELQAGREASKILSDLILNKQIFIRTYKDRQTFGRYEADVYYFNYETNKWVSVADVLKEKGYDWK